MSLTNDRSREEGRGGVVARNVTVASRGDAKAGGTTQQVVRHVARATAVHSKCMLRHNFCWTVILRFAWTHGSDSLAPSLRTGSTLNFSSSSSSSAASDAFEMLSVRFSTMFCVLAGQGAHATVPDSATRRKITPR